METTMEQVPDIKIEHRTIEDSYPHNGNRGNRVQGAERKGTRLTWALDGIPKKQIKINRTQSVPPKRGESYREVRFRVLKNPGVTIYIERYVEDGKEYSCHDVVGTALELGRLESLMGDVKEVA